MLSNIATSKDYFDNNFLISQDNKLGNDLLAKNDKPKNSPIKNIVLCAQGQAGYIKAIDLDEDGKITLDEFNQYCEENSVSEDDKQKFLQAMLASKMMEEMTQKDSQQEKGIYAKRGEKKYNEKMDKNKDNTITYDEYIKYCSSVENDKIKTNKEQSPELKKALEAYIAQNENEPEIKVESKA